jgi:hypothetical protein
VEEGGVSSQSVLGLDLAKASLPDAIAAMVEAWYDAQNVEDQGQKNKKVDAASFLESDLWADEVVTYCHNLPNEFTTNQALIILKLVSSESAITRADQMRIAPILKWCGYVKDQEPARLGKGNRGRLWRPEP